MNERSNMYAEAKTWNPFKGCDFACVYCIPSFQKQSKRQKRLCHDCYNYTPHRHEDRLRRIPSSPVVFVCGNSDISFCPLNFARKIIKHIAEHNARAPYKTYYFQSKKPVYFEPLLHEFPENVILLTTLETNRDQGYDRISKAPCPSVRFEQFKALRRSLPGSFPSDSVWDPEGLAESYLQATADTHVFTLEAATDRLKAIRTPQQALDIALQFEKDSVAFFVGMKEMLPDPNGKGEIDKLIQAEMDHVRMLSTAKKTLAEKGSATIT